MSAIHWFEIPVSDIQRASAFYEKVLGAAIHIVDMTAQMGSMLGMLENRGGVGGALVQNSQYGYTPSKDGALVYLKVKGNLDSALNRVEAGGGQVILPKTPLGEDVGGGFTAWIIDSEGNKVALFAEQ